MLRQIGNLQVSRCRRCYTRMVLAHLYGQVVLPSCDVLPHSNQPPYALVQPIRQVLLHPHPCRSLGAAISVHSSLQLPRQTARIEHRNLRASPNPRIQLRQDVDPFPSRRALCIARQLLLHVFRRIDLLIIVEDRGEMVHELSCELS
jgi:hypothetical protein